MPAAAGCVLCEQVGGVPVWHDDEWRVIRVDDADFPGYYRVVLRRHAAEFSQLTRTERLRCIDVIDTVERTLIEMLRPTKINLAALGNMVPHLHWHVIARFDWDSHFPQPVWGERQRQVEPPAAERLATSLADLDAAIVRALETL
jgi:diadenosine tetraphosphate (Ap4A) HIT family hydrolase